MREREEVLRQILKHIQTLSLNNSNINHKRKKNQLPIRTTLSETTEFLNAQIKHLIELPKKRKLLVRRKRITQMVMLF